jgi:tRNA (cytidine32/uridine32-2'-O)-methyltransferase
VVEPVKGDAAGRVLKEQLVIVLVRPQQAGNVGAAARAMRNMGLRKLVVVNPPLFDVDRARWMAPGSAEILDSARYVGSVDEAVADCHRVLATTARDRHWRWPAFDLEGFVAQPFLQPEDREAWTKTAILFGPEDAGLSNQDIAYAHALLHIQTDSNASLNLSQAVLLVAAALFAEARKLGWQAPATDGVGLRGGERRGAAPVAGKAAIPAPQERLEWLVQEWLSALSYTGYLKGHEEVLVSTTLRQIVQRAALDEREVVALRGMFKKMRYAMRRAKAEAEEPEDP